MGLTVRVTKADIAAGKCKDPRGCPIAIAIRRQLGIKRHEVLVGSAEIMLLLDGDPVTTVFRTSKKASNFIFKFDRKLPVKPTAFVFREQ